MDFFQILCKEYNSKSWPHSSFSKNPVNHKVDYKRQQYTIHIYKFFHADKTQFYNFKMSFSMSNWKRMNGFKCAEVTLQLTWQYRMLWPTVSLTMVTTATMQRACQTSDMQITFTLNFCEINHQHERCLTYFFCYDHTYTHWPM